MRNKVRLGLILTSIVGFLYALSPKTSEVRLPKDLVIESRHATMEEKRENRRIAKAYANAGWGWRGEEWLCLKELWTRESRFDHLATNPKSSAFGIPQLLRLRDPNPRIQILRGLRYIEYRYERPCKAWSFWLKNKHY